MTSKEIEELAGHRPVSAWVIKLVGDAIAIEREACAKLCDEQEKRSKESSEKSKRERDQFMYHHCAITAKWNAQIIRARGHNE